MTARIWFDGACHNKKGELTPMGVGVWAEIDGKVVYELAYAVPVLGTSNVAEYVGCWLALKKALELAQLANVNRVVISGDSKTIVNQVNEIWEVRAVSLLEFNSRCIKLFKSIKKFKPISIVHVRRQFNQRADVLSKKGLKKNVFA